MSDKRHQLSILDQWASQSGQVSRSTERLAEIRLAPAPRSGHLMGLVYPSEAISASMARFSG